MTERRKIDPVTLEEDTERVENLRKFLARARAAAQALRWVSKFVLPTTKARDVYSVDALRVKPFGNSQDDTSDGKVFETYLARAFEQYDELILEQAIELARTELNYGTEIHEAVKRNVQRQISEERRREQERRKEQEVKK